MSWRLELGIIAAILAAHHWLTQPIPDPWATTLILTLIAGLTAWPRTRNIVTTALWHARVRRAWTRAVIDTGAADPPPGRSRRPASRHGPKARRIRDVLAGELVTVRIPRGDSVATLEQRDDALAACLQVKEVRITREGDNARHCHALLVRRDPFSDPTPIPWPNKDTQMDSMRDPIPIDPNTRLWLIDGKRVELAAWAPCAQQIAHTPKQAADLLRRLRQIMDDRYRELEVLGRRHVTPQDGLPLHLLICDELAFFTANENAKDKKQFIDLFRDIVARGRAAGVLVIAATQKPSVDVVPSAIRDLFPFKLALRCATPPASDTILGQGWASEGADASTIPAKQRGVGYLLSEGARPERVKGYRLDDEGVGQIASRASGRHADAWLQRAGEPGAEQPSEPEPNEPSAGPEREPADGEA
jgi:hypothetical protein